MSHSSYRNIHRLVLQAFVQEAAISVGDLEKLVVKLCNKLQDRLDDFNGDMTRSLDHFILVINQKLESFGMGLKLKKRRAVELDGKVYWVLVNTLADFTSKLATDLSDKELLAFKKILKFLATSKYGNITFKELSKDLDHEAKEALLDKLLVGKWLEVCPSGGNGKYTAGLRTMVELEHVMRDLGARECTLNGTPVLLTRPYQAWLRQQTGEEVNVNDLESIADKSGNDNSGSDEEDEDEDEEEETEKLPENNRTRQSLRARLKTKRGKRVQDNNSSDDDDDDDDDEEEEEEEQETMREDEKGAGDEDDEEEDIDDDEDDQEDDDNKSEEVPVTTKARRSRNSRQASKREQLVEEDHSDDEEEEGEVVEVEDEDEEEEEEEEEIPARSRSRRGRNSRQASKREQLVEEDNSDDEEEEESEDEEEETPARPRLRRNLKRQISKTNSRKQAEVERANVVKKARTKKTRRNLRTSADRNRTEAQEDSSEEEDTDDEDRNESQSPPSRAASKRPIRHVENSYIDEESSEESG